MTVTMQTLTKELGGHPEPRLSNTPTLPLTYRAANRSLKGPPLPDLTRGDLVSSLATWESTTLHSSRQLSTLEGRVKYCLFLNCRRKGETSFRQPASRAGVHRETPRTPRVPDRRRGGERAGGRRVAWLREGAAGLGCRANRAPRGGSARPPASRLPEGATRRLGSGSTFFPPAGSRGTAPEARGGHSRPRPTPG